jgi:integrase
MQGRVFKTETWGFVFDLPKVDGVRQQYRRQGYRTKADAAQAMREAIENFGKVAGTSLTLERFINEKWWPVHSVELKSSTKGAYKTILNRHIVPRLGKCRVAELDVVAVKEFRAELISLGLAQNTVRNALTVLKAICRSAVEHRLLAENPTSSVRHKKKNGTAMKIRALTSTQLASLLAYWKDDPIFGVVYTAAMTGMRRGEVLGLWWEDVDLATGSLRVNRNLVSVAYAVELTTPKSETSERDVFLPPQLVSYLRALKTDRDAAGVSSPHVFVTAKGEPFHPDYIRQRYRRRMLTWSGPTIRFHDLRHTWATIALDSGVGINAVSEMLGHYDAGFTYSVYGHSLPNSHSSAAETFGRALDQAVDKSPESESA